MNTNQDRLARIAQSKQVSKIAKLTLSAWIVLIIGGTLAITAYSNTPGVRPETVACWPETSTLTRSEDSPTVVLFLHPKCPCSVSTLREMERALSGNSDQVEVQIGLFCPPNEPDEWTKTSLSKFAEHLKPGSTFIDRSAVEARRFGVLTSGHVLVFSASGKILFSGGVTAAKGHDGENRGGLALRSLCRGDDLPLIEQPVFGCPIIESSTSESKREIN